MRGARASIALAFAALLVATLAGCGFRPLYGRHAGDAQVNSELTAIYIRPLPDREGQLLHNALLVRFNPQGAESASRYRLEVSLASNEAPTVLQSDQTASRALVTFSVSYRLYEEQIALTSGNFSRVFSYDYVPEQYSNVSARGDVGRRAAEEIADQLRDLIAAYFAAGAKARAAAGQTQ
jgi:LPS-assembly lipoprotein